MPLPTLLVFGAPGPGTTSIPAYLAAPGPLCQTVHRWKARAEYAETEPRTRSWVSAPFATTNEGLETLLGRRVGWADVTRAA
jgi:hypothetical protein